jgi:hypothetical protein
MGKDPHTAGKPVQHVVTLVHGTVLQVARLLWRGRVQWLEEGSAVWSALQEALPNAVEIHPFYWSGANTLRARQRAAMRLRAHLLAEFHRVPNGRHYIIAHSHGGNVALLALRDPEIARGVAGLACFSTPFLHGRARPLGAAGPIVIGLTLFLAWAMAVGFSGIMDLLEPWPGWVLLWVPTLFLLEIVRELWRLAATATREGLQFDELTHPIRLLIVRSAGDEASAVLSAMQFISWVATRAWGPALVIGRRLAELSESVPKQSLRTSETVVYAHGAALVFLFAVLGMILASEFAPQPYAVVGVVLCAMTCLAMIGFLILLFQDRSRLSPWVAFRAGVLGVVTFSCVSLFLTPTLLVAAIVAMPFAPELALVAIAYEVTVEATPPGTWPVHQLPFLERVAALPPGARVEHPRWLSLMHSASYEDPRALKLLSAWVTST